MMTKTSMTRMSTTRAKKVWRHTTACSGRLMLTIDFHRDERGGQRSANPFPSCAAPRLIRRLPEQLRQGTTKVREALGPDYSAVSNKQIEEALWNYYYDVAKSVSYLKSEQSPGPRPPSCLTSA